MTMTKKRKHAISDEMNTDKEDELNFKAKAWEVPHLPEESETFPLFERR